MKTLADMQAVVNQLTYKDWEFVLHWDECGDVKDIWLQVQFEAEDSETGIIESQHCRKWRLSVHMTTTEIVRTAYKALLAAVEHEASEEFRYMNCPLFHPHVDICKLGQANYPLDRREPIVVAP